MTVSLVTGGAGFIGSHIVHQLVERGDQVKILDNFSTGKWENLVLIGDDVEIIEGDLREAQQVVHAVKGVDLVFHQAAMVSVPLSMEDPQFCFDVNVKGTLNLLQAAQIANVKQVVMASSCAVYGDSDDYPLAETGETMSLSPYAASKKINEIYADMYTRTSSMGVSALRYFNVYGPRQAPDSDYAAAIPIFINRLLKGEAVTIYGDGLQSRDFVFVDDVVRANLLASEATDASGAVFNVCTGDEITIVDLMNVLQTILPNTPSPNFDPPREGDIYRSLGDPGLIGEKLGFEAKTNLSDGLRQTIKWMRQ
ncbi:MAG: NAD-dependent epimerase/dehydratase family protein [Anaerolineales bacterium]|nr:NAD-dependent epimerase/dehydratase family protein [Chloroflexota bacterium]MBL6981683.1 NAD-dependent epimerase/dehydratase family protein [Anaerolineales bacterium]